MNNRSRNTLVSSLPYVATMMAQQAGIDVQIGGNMALTSGRVVRLPDLPLQDETLEDLTFGMLVHEIGHIRNTDFEYVRGLQLTPFETTLLNGFDDYQADKANSRTFPGAEKRRCKAIAISRDLGYLRDPEQTDMASQLSLYLISRLSGRFMNRSVLLDMERKALQVLKGVLPSSTLQKICAEIDGSADIESTEDAYHAVKRVVGLLQLEADRLEDQAQNGTSEEQDGSPEGEGDQGSNDGAGGDTPGDDNSAGSSSESSGGDESDAQQCGDTQPAGMASQPVDPKAAAQALRSMLAGNPSFNGDLGDAVKNALQASAAQYARKPDADESNVALSVPQLRQPPTASVTSIDLAEIRKASMALQFRLETLLEGLKDSNRSYVSQGGRLVPSRLWRVPLGQADVFRRRTEEEAVNTAVSVMLDVSGSTKNTVGVILSCGLSLALALEQVPDLVCQISAFPYGDANALLKPFDSSVRACQANFSALTANGNTPMAQALLRAGVDLQLREETRRIVVVVTDGIPDKLAPTVRILESLRDDGVETLGIGIGASARIGDLFPTAMTISDVNQLPKALFSQLGQQLLKRAA